MFLKFGGIRGTKESIAGLEYRIGLTADYAAGVPVQTTIRAKLFLKKKSSGINGKPKI